MTLGAAERRHWLDRMAETLARFGHEQYVSGPIVQPIERHFPDPYSHDLRGVRSVARRLARFAGLENPTVEVVGAHWARDDGLADTLVVLTSVEPSRLELAVSSLGLPEDVPLVTAHEIAAAYHWLRGRALAEGHPYRTPVLAEEVEDPTEREDEAISLVGYCLGFGALAVKGAHRYRAEGQLQGPMMITRWVHHSVGALHPEVCCFLLAAQVVARGSDEAQVDALASCFGVNESTSFRRYVRELGADPPGLRQRLRLPPPEAWPPSEEPGHLPLLEDDGWEPADEGEDAAEPARPVFRRRRHRGWALAASTGGIVAAGLFFVVTRGPDAMWASLVAAPLLCLVAYRIGKRLPMRDACSWCDAELAAEAEACPACRGLVRGTIGPSESHLAAVESLPGVTVFGDHLAQRQPDAHPEYSARGVQCPHCGWIPDGQRHWTCEECHVEPFDTFAQDATCPGCAHAFDETLCPACDHVSPYDFWLPEEAVGPARAV